MTAAIICIAVLYGIDGYWFDGRYFTALTGIASDVYRHLR